MKNICSHTPFLWMYLKKINVNHAASGGQERISTESLAEENSTHVIKIT